MTLESDGIINVWDIDTRRVIAQYEGLKVHDAMQSVAQLRATLDAVPVDALRRYYACTHYDVYAANDANCTTQQFDADCTNIDIWFAAMDNDA